MRSALATVLTVALGALSCLAPQADAASAARHGGQPETRMLLTFDHQESLKRGSLVRDASGHHHPGRVLARSGGKLTPVKGLGRRAAAFPRACDAGCGRAIIEVADRQGLDPRRRSFGFGAAVRVTTTKARLASNVVQKGYYRQAGGQYKLQLLAGGTPSCVVAGAKGRLIVPGPRSIATGTWHRLSCVRTPDSVLLFVDGELAAQRSGATGFLGNDSPLRIGGKKIKPANKQFHGTLDRLYVRLL